VKARFAGQTIDAGIILSKDNAYVDFRGQSYEVGEQLFSQLRSSFKQQQDQAGGGQQSLKQFGIDPTDWLDHPKVEKGEDIGGDSTQKISGDVDVKKVVEDVLGALRSPALRRQLESQGQAAPQVPEVDGKDIDKVADAIKELRFEVNVDKNGVARRLFAEADFDVPEGADAGPLEGGKVSFGFVLEKVGVDPEIKAPASPQPLGVLLRQFGLGSGLNLPQRQ
jgi:hypothetical protein